MTTPHPPSLRIPACHDDFDMAPFPVAAGSKDEMMTRNDGRQEEDNKDQLLGLLWLAYHEFNAIRARSGAPLDQYGMTLVDEQWWSDMTDMFAAAIGPESTTPWPSKEAKALLSARQEQA